MAKRRWKKNLRAVPPNIIARINSFESDQIKVACVIAIREDDIRNGLYEHIGIHWDQDKPVFPDFKVPLKATGYHSRWNREGREIIYKDRPKEEKSWSVDAPNYGDPHKGYHSVDFSREVYPREFVPPKLLRIIVECGYRNEIEHTYPFVFTVDEVLDRRTPSFMEALLFNLNLLQENIGNHDVQKADTTLEQYLDTLYVTWEILPPGEKEETFQRILSGIRSDNPQLREQIKDRYDFLMRLEPRNFIRGMNEFRRYFGAQFADDLVVFENLEYGNAVYVMFDDWETLSKKSRIELMRGREGNFVRILHTTTWKRRLWKVIHDEKLKRGIR